MTITPSFASYISNMQPNDDDDDDDDNNDDHDDDDDYRKIATH